MKRMVSNHTIQDFEDRISALEEGGSGTEYTAGDNITIENGVISAKDTIYNGGYGIYKDDAEESYYFTGNGTNTVALTENGVGIDFSVITKSGGNINATNDGLDLVGNIVVDSVEAGNITVSATNNANLIHCDDNTKPLEVSSANGAWIRIDATGLVSLTMVDSTTSTAHLYEFKADGIYLDNVKITS